MKKIKINGKYSTIISLINIIDKYVELRGSSLNTDIIFLPQIDLMNALNKAKKEKNDKIELFDDIITILFDKNYEIKGLISSVLDITIIIKNYKELRLSSLFIRNYIKLLAIAIPTLIVISSAINFDINVIKNILVSCITTSIITTIILVPIINYVENKRKG